MEQRIQSLEEEVKILKNQIRSVLLDIKENLASGDWQTHQGNNKAADLFDDSDQQPQEEELVNLAIHSRPATETKSIPASKEGKAGCDGENESIEQEAHHTQIKPPDKTGVRMDTDNNGHNEKSNQRQTREYGKPSGNNFEPLTLMLLLQWLERAQTSLGREQAQALIELYCTGRDLPEESRRTLQLVTALFSRNKEKTADTETVQYLIELDQLLNNRDESGNLQSLVLKSLACNRMTTADKK